MVNKFNPISKYTNKDGTVTKWKYSFYNDNHDRIRETGFDTRPEAKEAYQKALSREGKGKQDKYLTFGEAANQYIELYARLYCKEATCDNYEQVLRTHILPFFKNVRVIDINMAKGQKFIQERKKASVSNSKINECIKIIKSILNRLVDIGTIPENPLRKLKKLEVIDTDIQVYDPEEVNALLEEAKKNHAFYYPMLFTAIFTGLREGELIALTWQDVNWVKKKLRINKTFSKKRLGPPKTQASSRHVDIPDKLLTALREWKLRCPPNDLNLIFPSEAGTYRNPDNFTRRFYKNCVEGAGLTRIKWHSLRHTYASLLILQGVPIKYIQQQMGHSSIKMTMDTYAHLLPDVHDNAVKALDAIIGQPKKQNEIRKKKRK